MLNFHITLFTEQPCLERTLCQNIIQNVVNFIKLLSVQTRLLAILFHEMGSDHESLLFHTEVRWLSWGKVLIRLFELHEEVCILLSSDCSSSLAAHLTYLEWVTSLAYLAGIVEQPHCLNMALQGPNTNILALFDKVTAFKKKLECCIV